MLDTKDKEKFTPNDVDDVVIINSDEEEDINNKNNTKSMKLKVGLTRTKQNTKDGIKRSVQLIKYSENIQSLTITRSGKIRRRNVECVINITDETEVVDLSTSNIKNVNRRKCSKATVGKEKADCNHKVNKVERILPKCGRHTCGNKIPCRRRETAYKCIRRRHTKLKQDTNVNINNRSKDKKQPTITKSSPLSSKETKSPLMWSLSDFSLPSCLDVDKDYVMYEDINSDDDFSSDQSEKLEMLIKRTKQREKTWTFSSNEFKQTEENSNTNHKGPLKVELSDMDISLDSVSTVFLDDNTIKL